MPVIQGAGNTWNLPNYAGELFTADETNTPILTAIGGLTGGLQTDNFEFTTDSQYDLPPAIQPQISETASLSAQNPISYSRTQNTNVTQIHQETVNISYEKLSNSGRMSGLNTAGQQNNVPDEKDFQIATTLKKIARDIEASIINGVFCRPTNAGEAGTTRGMLELCRNANNITPTAPVDLDRTLMQQLFKLMFDNGAVFSNIVLWVNSYQKQIITDIYSFAPTDRNVGGVNMKQIETDFGNIGIALNRFMPQTAVLAMEMSAVAPVFQPVPGKGNFFYEELAKVGASERGQIYGKFGLDHGPSFLHGSIEGLVGA